MSYKGYTCMYCGNRTKQPPCCPRCNEKLPVVREISTMLKVFYNQTTSIPIPKKVRRDK